jgi:hypothetical protein
LRSEKAQALMQMKRELEGDGGIDDGEDSKRKSKKKKRRDEEDTKAPPPDCSFDPADYEDEV